MSNPAHDSVLDRFLLEASRRPDAPVYTELDDDGREVETVTYAQMHEAAATLAAHLRDDLGLAPGDHALLVYPPSMDFVRAFVACLWAGVVPVPLPPPNPLELSKELGTLSAIARSADARVVLTNRVYARARTLGRVKSFFTRRGDLLTDLPWHTTDAVRSRGRVPAHAGGGVAFLQYTSGSTSTPRGVMITHDNLLHQLAANAEELGLGPDVRAVSWLPQFHDFGLVSAILSALVGNGHLYFMSPLAFVRRPAVWLEVMSRVRATHTAAPNFAFELAVRKTTPAERARYDLSALRVVMSAAEPILPATVDAFLEAFAPSGLAKSAFCPAYGLAEHTVGVSVFGRRRVRVDRAALELERAVVPPTASTKDTAVLVGCGAPSPGVRVVVVDPETRRRVSAGAVGELWVASRSVGAGYFGQPEASEETFRARLAGPDDDGTRWLRTGDLGTVFEGEIFVTGRAKDLVIVRGRNVQSRSSRVVAEFTPGAAVNGLIE